MREVDALFQRLLERGPGSIDTKEVAAAVAKDDEDYLKREEENRRLEQRLRSAEGILGLLISERPVLGDMSRKLDALIAERENARPIRKKKPSRG